MNCYLNIFFKKDKICHLYIRYGFFGINIFYEYILKNYYKETIFIDKKDLDEHSYLIKSDLPSDTIFEIFNKSYNENKVKSNKYNFYYENNLQF